MMNFEIRAKLLRETDCMRVTHGGDSPLMVESSGICGVGAARCYSFSQVVQHLQLSASDVVFRGVLPRPLWRSCGVR